MNEYFFNVHQITSPSRSQNTYHASLRFGDIIFHFVPNHAKYLAHNKQTLKKKEMKTLIFTQTLQHVNLNRTFCLKLQRSNFNHGRLNSLVLFYIRNPTDLIFNQQKEPFYCTKISCIVNLHDPIKFLLFIHVQWHAYYGFWLVCLVGNILLSIGYITCAN